MPDFFTRQGDDGTTGLLGEGRVPKNHPVPEAVGALDEASAALGMARAVCRSPETATTLAAMQRDLYGVMAEVAAAPGLAERFRQVNVDRVAWVEAAIERFGNQIDMPGEFILPGDSHPGAALAVARTVVRRAERHLAGLLHSGELENPHLLPYLNRLSSLCFVLEIYENRLSGVSAPSLAKSP